MEILCFFAGIAFVFVNKLYPCLFLLIVLYFRLRLSFVIWFLCAVVWGYCHGWLVASSGMPTAPVINPARLEGVVDTIPVVQEGRVQFVFKASQLNGEKVASRILLSCYNKCPEFRIGQKYSLIAKLKKPRNLGNPGSFDVVNWLKSHHIDWNGTVFSPSIHLEGQNKVPFITRIRERLISRSLELGFDENALGITQALTLGLTTHISKDQWELFRHTGTIHLIDISGSHIGLIAGIVFFLMRKLWSRYSILCLFCPAPRVASFAAIFCATFYTALIGFAIPAQRALIGCVFMLAKNFLPFPITQWQAWRYALLTVLIFEPHSVLMVGFYLSFMGVAILMLTHSRIKLNGLKKLFILQVACLIGLMPLSLYWFSYGSLNGMIANCISIPLVELWIVPLALVVILLSYYWVLPGGVFLIKHSIMLFLRVLHWVDAFSQFNLMINFSEAQIPIALMIAILTIFCFPFYRFAIPLILLVLAALFHERPVIAEGEAEVNVLDVGQGLAIVVRTSNHVLVYDTGMQFFQGSDMGKIAVIPYLQSLGIKKLDTVVISHPDLDHRGGLSSIEKQFSVHELIVDSPLFYHRGKSCHSYSSWNWDGVTFRFFPLITDDSRKNNHSCVLKISTNGGQILLTGDIEKSAETYLSNTFAKQLKSSILLIPHHESKTSSSEEFVSAVAPKYAVVSYGFDNRYHFPHQQAIDVYKKMSIPVFNTVDCGMISVRLNSSGLKVKPECNL